MRTNAGKPALGMPGAVIALTLLVCATAATAPAAPLLNVHPDTLRFYGNFCGGSWPVGDSMVRYAMVGNTGDGDMTWTGTPLESWVAVSPQAGGNFDSVAVWIVWENIPRLFAAPQPGDTLFFESPILFESPQADNSPQYVLVQLGLFCQPDGYILTVYPGYLDLVMPPGMTAKRHIYVQEAYGQSIEFSYSNHESWLSMPVPIVPPNTPDSVECFISTEGLEPGMYYDTIVVTTPAQPSNSPQTIPVRLQVTGGDIILAAEPPSFEYTLQPGETFIGDSLLVYEVSGMNINFWTYNSSSWLYVDTMVASPLYTPGALFVYISTWGLLPGLYIDTIWIWADGAGNVPLTIPVVLTIEGGGDGVTIQTFPEDIRFSISPGTAVAMPLTVYETHGYAVEFQAEAKGPWVELSGIGPYLTPADIMVSVSADSLPVGFYQDTIFISSTSFSPEFPTKAVPVYIDVIESGPVLWVSPDIFHVQLPLNSDPVNLSFAVLELSGQRVPFAVQTMLGSSWLILQPDSLPYLTNDTVYFDVDPAGLEAGIYTDEIIVYNPLDGPPWYYETRVPVFLAYGDSAGYRLAASPPELYYTLDTNQIFNDSLVVYEVFGRQIPFFHYNSSSWLAVDPLGMPPYLTPASLRVAVNTAGLEPGGYVDTIFIAQIYDSLPGPSPMLAVPVYLMVGINVVFGDSNGDLKVDVGDVLYIVNYIFRDGAAPEEMAADANCNGMVEVGDAVYLVAYTFKGGPSPGCR